MTFATPFDERAFKLYYAKVLVREARARRNSAFAITLLIWAGRARREAFALPRQPAQPDLFAAYQ